MSKNFTLNQNIIAEVNELENEIKNEFYNKYSNVVPGKKCLSLIMQYAASYESIETQDGHISYFLN